jgi:Rps23 Pro-64 3,4-dihydroxylase Tpa1-like proline 4-hydroxylase
MNDIKGNSIFNLKVYESLLTCNTYKTAAPYPHIVVDDLFNPIVLETLLQEWPLQNSNHHESHNDGVFVKSKRGTTAETVLPIYTEYLLYQLSRPKFLKFLEQLTGIDRLIPDPYNFGGGLHETLDGGKLAVHVDYNKHNLYKLDRRINFLIYLNKDWTIDMGGELELWDHSMSECIQKILPIFNRTVIFSTISTSFHGQPEPVMCGADNSRKSIALYYYSNGRPEEQTAQDEEHSTLWKTRPGKGY